MSGAVNGDVAIQIKVTKEAKDSQYQSIIRLVKESQAKPANFVRMADRYAVPFTLIAYLIGGVAWFISGDPVRFAEVLVVASPCPLILAAPIALVAGMSRSSRNGIVIKTGTTLEKLAKGKTFAFDKTGTLTEGQLFVSEVLVEAPYSKEDMLQLAISLEQQSTHILARSLIHYGKEKEIITLPIKNLTEVSGKGVCAQLDTHSITLGNASYIHVPPAKLSDKTVTYLAVDGKYIGQIRFNDRIRQEVPKTIANLRARGFQKMIMLTGDEEKIAEEIGKKVGITDVRSECLPQDKINVLAEASADMRPIVMVGDGVNDAPALAIADVGIAMGAHGSTAASESADAVILKDDLSKVYQATVIAQDTMKIARQSVLIGIFICVFLMLLASTGWIPALLGAALQEVVDTVSILSALRDKND